MIDWESTLGEQRKKEEETKKKKQEEQKELTQEKYEGEEKLIYTAQETLRDFLTKKFENIILTNPSIESFLKNFAPFLLTFNNYRPQSYSYSSSTPKNCIKIIPASLKPNSFKKICGKIVDGYLEETDFFNSLDENKTYNNLLSFFPENKIINNTLLGNKSFSYNSPLDVVMMMEEPEKKALMAISTKKYLEKIQKKELITGNIILPYLPNLETIIETAKEYNIKEVKGILQNFSNYTGNIQK